MSLTKVQFQQINTNLTAFSDPITITNFGNIANRDIGEIFDRSQGGGSNVTIIWQESTQSFRLAYTSSTGITSGNLTLTGNANLRVGNVYADSVSWSNGTSILSGLAGGSTTQLQYNNGGQFAGATGLTTDGVATLNAGTLQASNIGNVGAGILGSNVTAINSLQGPIGVYGANTAAFTTISTTGNLTVAALTVNGTATVGSTLSAAAGLQGTAVGNLQQSSGKFTTLEATAGLNNTVIGNVTASTAQFTTVSTSGNITASALVVNNSAVIGGALGVSSSIYSGGIVSATNNLIINAPSPQAEGAQIVLAWANVSGLTGQANSTWNIDVDSAANLRLFYQDAGGSAAVPFRITSSPGVGNIYMPGNIFVGGYFYSNGSVFSGGGGGSGTPGGNNSDIQYNASGVFAGASYLHYLAGNGQVVANAGISSTSTGTGSFIVTGGVGVSGNVTADIVHAVNNGNGTNFQVGDDVWIGDINVANTMRVAGQQDGTQGYIVFGNSNALSLGRSGTGALTYQGAFTAQGGLQNTPIGNTTASTGQFTTLSATGNVTGAALTSNTSITAITTLNALGGLQATPIGNVTPSSALFTTVGASANATINALTVNNSATIGTTLGVVGNVTANYFIGNGSQLTGIAAVTAVTATTATYVTGLTSANVTTALGYTPTNYANSNVASYLPVYGGSINASTITGTANATVNDLTINNSVTIGTTLGVTGNAIIGNISGVGRIISTDITNATGTGTGALVIVGGGSVTKDFFVGGNLYTSNLIAVSSANLVVQDPLLYLTANTPYPYSYEIGVYSNFIGGAGNIYQHTGFVRDHSDFVWKLFSNATEPSGSTLDFTNANVVYDSIKTGSHTVLGALVANSTGSFGGNVTANALTVNNSVTVGSTLGVTGNVNTNAVYTTAGIFWAGNSAPYAAGGGGTSLTFTASASAPSSPAKGDMWYNTSNNVLYEYVTDGTSTFWLDNQSPVVTANGNVTLNTTTTETLSPFLLMGA